ncbi:hypothetical protein [Saccharicrinis aurantiacus]|uniref:hypothetical protein n=1 Tax=Saccharicrinis aurantiacus TaxID=1849719 RepID=UPI00094F5BA7|nr:hypothetical protein [Saccharicrinis aurantiacus]
MNLFKSILFLSVAFTFFSCDPLDEYRDDLNDNLEADDDWYIFISERDLATEAEYNANSPYVLTDEDYEMSSNKSVADYKNFSDSAPFDEYLPETIHNLYGNNGELVTVQFAYYLGSEGGTVDSTCFVTYVRETPADSSYWQVVPNYELIESDNKESTNTYTLIASDYTMVGEGYPNFDLRYNTKADIIEKINTIIKSHHMLDLEEGQIWQVSFATYGEGSEVITSPMYLEVIID